MKDIIVFGSTGSIGTQTLNIVRRNRDKFNIVGLTCNSNTALLDEQVKEFAPRYVAISDEKKGKEFASSHPDIEVIYGNDAASRLADVDEGQLIVAAQVGISGLIPTIKAIKKGKNVALANKETLVTGGEYVMNLAEKMGVQILPVDSEHSAIWQSLHFKKPDSTVKRLILTASGGAFRDYPFIELKRVKVEDALKHPTWNMGAKVTIDSATMMNKGLEVIEAKHLFNMDVDNISVVIHKESIIHSMVEYTDNSVMAEMSYPSMELPIALALTYPERVDSEIPSIEWQKLKTLSFTQPDMRKYRCLTLAIEAAKMGGLSTVVLNAANEVLVEMFLKRLINYLDIPYHIERTLNDFKVDGPITPESIIDCDSRVRSFVLNTVKR